MGCEIVAVYTDQGISGAKGRDQRPQFDALCKAARKDALWLLVHRARGQFGKFGHQLRQHSVGPAKSNLQ
jgi:Resolvase, N terminal domain